MTKIILASQSPARLKILRDAGLSPIVQPSEVDEDAVLTGVEAQNPEHYVTTLSRAKAEDVAEKTTSEEDTLILGADSALSFEGQILGKPGVSELAIRRWQSMRGKTGMLYSGQTLIDLKTKRSITRFSATKVWFSDITDNQIEKYVASGEPLQVAGAFTIDSLGGAFIDRIEGDYHTVVGLSLKLLREMITELGHEYTDFWE